MTSDKTKISRTAARREEVLDAAERLLSSGRAEFSMRDLAAEAGVSFATPFNQFGSKAAIMQALSSRRIALMRDRLADSVLPRDATERVLLAAEIAADVMLTSPEINRAVMGALGGPNSEPSHVSAQSEALWAEALGKGEGLSPSTKALACAELPSHLAIVFRGVLSFWTAGEISDVDLIEQARASAAIALLGFAGRDSREALLTVSSTFFGGARRRRVP